MDLSLWEAIEQRHSVRSYSKEKISGEAKSALLSLIDQCNEEAQLNFQLLVEEPQAFDCLLARVGKFHNADNYFALVGNKDDDQLAEKCGYYGEKLVLLAQQLGLNTCWVAGSFSRGKCQAIVNEGEKLLIVISVGYGEDHGHPHKSRPLEELASAPSPWPEWFRKGAKAAQLAPTARNQQKFHFTLQGERVLAETKNGPFAKIDLGIAKYHFEVGAENATWQWE